MPIRFSTLVLPKRHPEVSSRPCDDRVETSRRGDALAILVADGATGIGEGWKASGRMADAFLSRIWDAPAADGIADLLREADRSIFAEHRGDADTTAIALVVSEGRVVGASAGDSQAYLVEDGSWVELTFTQSRKPRIGNGARPLGFEAHLTPRSRLLVASDGLWQQAAFREIQAAFEAARSGSGAASALADLGIAVAMA
jgi:serine/threonine protein phosphatase PrpC